MAISVFYAWQSDTPEIVNRAFIREALKRAINKIGEDPDIEEALSFDQDTQGLPGIPSIADAILQKINHCGIFVADLTFVASTPKKKKISNPNVLIELGYAMKAVGFDRIITVLNQAYGDPRELPFDLQHRRWPLLYRLKENVDPKTREEKMADLVGRFEVALRGILESGAISTSEVSSSAFEPAIPRWKESSFLADGEKLVTLRDRDSDETQDVIWKNGPQMFLRLYPLRKGKNFTTKQLDRAVWDAENLPLIMGVGLHGLELVWRPNDLGYVILNGSARKDGEPLIVTQIFENGEIWAIDNYYLRQNRGKNGKGFIPLDFEERLERALSRALNFSSTGLQASPPFKFKVGMVAVQDYPIYIPPQRNLYSRVEGSCSKDDIYSDEGLIEDPNASAHEALLPFFIRVWETCNLDRPEWLETSSGQH